MNEKQTKNEQKNKRKMNENEGGRGEKCFERAKNRRKNWKSKKRMRKGRRTGEDIRKNFFKQFLSILSCTEVSSPAYIENADKRIQTNFMIPDIKRYSSFKKLFYNSLIFAKI